MQLQIPLESAQTLLYMLGIELSLCMACPDIGDSELAEAMPYLSEEFQFALQAISFLLKK